MTLGNSHAAFIAARPKVESGSPSGESGEPWVPL